MVTEDKIRTRINDVWQSGDSPLRKARQLLSLSRAAKSLSGHLMNLGFRAHHAGENEAGQRFWSSSARIIDLSSHARTQAKAALEGQVKPPERDTQPQAPRWERSSDQAPYCSDSRD